MPDSVALHGTMVELSDDGKIVRHYEFKPAATVLEVEGQDVGAFFSGLCQTSCPVLAPLKYEMLHCLSSEAPQVRIPNVCSCACLLNFRFGSEIVT